MLQALAFRGKEEVLRLLLDVPFGLRKLPLTCETAPGFVEDILAHQRGLDELGVYLYSTDDRAVEHIDKTVWDCHVTISRTYVLPQLRILHVLTDRRPLASIRHPYHVTHLSSCVARHDDITHALALFSGQLIALKVARCIDENCTDACFWPASMVIAVERPLLRLQYVEIQDELDDWTTDVSPGGGLHIPSGAASCPATKTPMWRELGGLGW
ncbi:hypothetical protein C8Q73DRAFT_787781 [Cubamyces lactineus]|nr:hypothetical protein C8Q73DRAFT_787781 [Cubamyces lactineus]